jgi:(S)-2-hydroxyglutarate dehydrogenase
MRHAVNGIDRQVWVVARKIAVVVCPCRDGGCCAYAEREGTNCTELCGTRVHMSERYDVVIIGGGIVGLAVGREITRRFPRRRLVVLEKEARVGAHQSGHNSGVIHSGVYYKPGSLKASLCVTGAAAMVQFCREHGVPFAICGKLIVATSPEELPRLQSLLERGHTNGVAGLRMLGPEELREIEPHATGVAALHVPGTGVTDYARVSETCAELIAKQGGRVRTSTGVVGIRQSNGEVVLETTNGTVEAPAVINCAGLFSDRVSRMAGETPDVQIVPFRGEYYDLVPERAGLVRALIYPVPDPRFPFLGVHFTRRIHGAVDAGPNAVFAFKREGYRSTDFSLRDTVESLLFPGFWRVAAKHWRMGKDEARRAASKTSFVTGLQRLVPEIRAEDLVPGGSGVRAQAIHRSGALVDDFQFSQTKNMLHLYNVPSPAATASIAIGGAVVEMAAAAWGWG